MNRRLRRWSRRWRRIPPRWRSLSRPCSLWRTQASRPRYVLCVLCVAWLFLYAYICCMCRVWVCVNIPSQRSFWQYVNCLSRTRYDRQRSASWNMSVMLNLHSSESACHEFRRLRWQCIYAELSMHICRTGHAYSVKNIHVYMTWVLAGEGVRQGPWRHEEAHWGVQEHSPISCHESMSRNASGLLSSQGYWYNEIKKFYVFQSRQSLCVSM